MKKFFVIVMGILFISITKAQPSVLIAVYDFDTVASTVNSTTGAVRPSFVNNLVLSYASNFSSNGVSTVSGGFFSTGHTPPIGSRARIASNWSQTLNVNKYMFFELAPITGQTLVIDSINYYSAKSNQGPDTSRMRFSTNMYAPNSWYSLNLGDISWRRSSRTTGLPTSPLPIQFRLYSYHTGSTFNSAGTWRIDKVRIYGHLQDVFDLPVELLSFRGEAKESSVDLKWSTATETNNDYFTVYRSQDAIVWDAEVGRMPGAGNTQLQSDYTMVDAWPKAGINYYMLTQTDLDGTTKQLGIVAVDFGATGQSVGVVDMLGRTLEDTTFPRNTGIYILKDENGRYRKFCVIPP